MLNLNEILNQLPKSWDEITLEMFQKLNTCTVPDELTDGFLNTNINTIQMVHKLTDIPTEELEELTIRDITILGNTLNFISNQPIPKKTNKIKWKTFDEVSYNDFLMFHMNQHKHIERLHRFIGLYTKNGLTEEEALKMPFPELQHGFFLLRRATIKFLQPLIQSTQKQILKFTKKN